MWENNIRMDVMERRRESVDWMHVAGNFLTEYVLASEDGLCSMDLVISVCL